MSTQSVQVCTSASTTLMGNIDYGRAITRKREQTKEIRKIQQNHANAETAVQGG